MPLNSYNMANVPVQLKEKKKSISYTRLATSRNPSIFYIAGIPMNQAKNHGSSFGFIMAINRV